MKRRFYVSVLDNNERKVILTGDMLPIEIVVEKTEYISFDIQSNKKIEEDNILYKERQDEIYLTVIGNASKAKGFLRAVIDENHDFIIVHCKYTCKYDSKNQTLRILCWKNGTMINQEYHGPIRRIHVGSIAKVSFFGDTETVKFDINSGQSRPLCNFA